MFDEDLCPTCDEVVAIVDVHDEEDHRERRPVFYTVFDLACGHSVQVIRNR